MSYYELPAEGRGYYLFAHRPLWTTSAHFHSSPEFVFMEKGEAEVNLDGERRVLTAGNACFVDSFCVHSYRELTSLAYVVLGDKGYFDRFFRERGEWTFPKFFDFPDFDFLQSLYALCARARAAENAQTVFRGAAEMLCGELAEKVPLEKRQENKQAAFVCEVLRYAETHAAEDLSLSAMSTAFGYSREHLSRLMKKYLREPWNSYVNRLRAVKADRLLKEGGEENVLKIAYECGFDSPSTFYRAYKKEFGKTPKK